MQSALAVGLAQLCTLPEEALIGVMTTRLNRKSSAVQKQVLLACVSNLEAYLNPVSDDFPALNASPVIAQMGAAPSFPAWPLDQVRPHLSIFSVRSSLQPFDRSEFIAWKCGAMRAAVPKRA